MMAETHQDATPRAIGELWVGGDWACAHGDFSALRHVAHCLAACAPEPLHGELLEVADACASDPDRAGILWEQLERRLSHTGHA